MNPLLPAADAGTNDPLWAHLAPHPQSSPDGREFLAFVDDPDE